MIQELRLRAYNVTAVFFSNGYNNDAVEISLFDWDDRLWLDNTEAEPDEVIQSQIARAAGAHGTCSLPKGGNPGERLEPLDDVALVREAAAEEVRQEGGRVLPGNAIAVVMVPSSCRWSGTAGMPSPGHPPAAPLPARLPSRRRDRVEASAAAVAITTVSCVARSVEFRHWNPRWLTPNAPGRVRTGGVRDTRWKVGDAVRMARQDMA